MIDQLTLSRAAIEYGGTLVYPDCAFDQVSTDTRQIGEGQLFVALRGENFDAHQFLGQAAQSACGLVVEKADTSLSVPQWVVPDTTVALGQIARLNRTAFDGRMVAVTGSAGKTTVKEMLAAIFAHQDGADAVLATRGNLNNHIGVPLTLMSLTEKHRSAVIEMGASGPNEIGYLCNMASPDVALVNNVLPAHVEGFGSVEGIARAKGEIYQQLKRNATAVLNLDEVYEELWRSYIGERRCLTFSVSRRDANVRAAEVTQDALGRCHFRLETPVGATDIQLSIPGRHNVANALAAAAVAIAAGAGLAEVAKGLKSAKTVAGRMDIKELPTGDYLIDDSYNANPGSVKAAIDSLVTMPGRTILVLGDMAELGADEVEMHAEVGRYAANHGVAQLYTAGKLTAFTSDAFGEGVHCESKRQLIEALAPQLGSGVTILVKGSRSAGMDDVVKALEAEASTTGE
ncbi:UDP-N-acetylmuramoyl-tripeptide--D-alanyl-D-alanine ligase [Porticoccaceae bacterium LTM1]|nr:UDP-N-acetylmuramoyl-tripeptide--D-alanyl-D-alanine ligase [Porticoccaceae bacterium LTM1]